MFLKTFSWCLDAGKLKTEQKFIVPLRLHAFSAIFVLKENRTQSHSAKFLNWGELGRSCKLSRLIDFWGGGYCKFQKKISCRLISRGKDSYNEIPGAGGFPTLKKIMIIRLIILRNKLTPSCTSEKKSYITRVWTKKEFFPKPNHPFPFSKVKWSAPNYPFVCKTILYHFGQKFSCNFRLATSRLHWLRDRNCTKCSIVLISQVLSPLVFLFIYFYNWYTYKCSRTF